MSPKNDRLNACPTEVESGHLLLEIMDPAINQIRRFSPDLVKDTKPIAIAEFGAFEYRPQNGQLWKTAWIRDADNVLATGSDDHGL